MPTPCHVQVRTLAIFFHGVTSVAFAPDGKHVVAGTKDSLVKIWNAETGIEVPHSGLPRGFE